MRRALADQGEAVASMIQVWEALGLRVFLPFYMTTAGALLAAAGDRDGARQHYEESLALADETGMRFYDAETHRRLAQLESEPRCRDRERCARRSTSRARRAPGPSSCVSHASCASASGT